MPTRPGGPAVSWRTFSEPTTAIPTLRESIWVHNPAPFEPSVSAPATGHIFRSRSPPFPAAFPMTKRVARRCAQQRKQPCTPIAIPAKTDRKSTRLNSSHTVIYTLSLHDVFPISFATVPGRFPDDEKSCKALCPAAEATLYAYRNPGEDRSEEHTSELQSHRDLHSFPTRRFSDLVRHRSRPLSR